MNFSHTQRVANSLYGASLQLGKTVAYTCRVTGNKSYTNYIHAVILNSRDRQGKLWILQNAAIRNNRTI